MSYIINNNKKIVFFLVLYFLIIVLVYIFNADPQGVWVQPLYLFPPILATLSGLVMVKTYGLQNVNGRAFLLITLGYLCWAIGEIIWYVFKNFLNIDPYPSVADIFYLLAYPLVCVGIIKELMIAQISWKQLDRQVKIRSITSICILGLLVLYFGVYKVYDPDVDFWQNFFGMGYGIADFFLIGISMVALVMNDAYKGGKLGFVWRTLSLGFVVFLIGDILFSVFLTPYLNDEKPYIYIDFFWVAGYLLFSYAMLSNIIAIRSLHDRINNNNPR